MKSDLKHESLGEEFYDMSLLVTGAILVPGSFFACMYSKYRCWKRCTGTRSLDSGTYNESLIPAEEFLHFSIGLASSGDRENLRTYFETRSGQAEECRRRNEWWAFEQHAKFLSKDESPNGRATYVLELPGDRRKGEIAEDSEDRLANLSELLKKLVAVSRGAGRRPVSEPALTDDKQLQAFQIALGAAKLYGHMPDCRGDGMPGDSFRARVSTMREQRQLVDYLEFSAFWDKRHGLSLDAAAELASPRKRLLELEAEEKAAKGNGFLCFKRCGNDNEKNVDARQRKIQIPIQPNFLSNPEIYERQTELLGRAERLLAAAEEKASSAAINLDEYPISRYAEKLPVSRKYEHSRGVAEAISLLKEETADVLTPEQVEQLIEFSRQVKIFPFRSAKSRSFHQVGRRQATGKPDRCSSVGRSLCCCLSSRDTIGVEELLLPAPSAPSPFSQIPPVRSDIPELGGGVSPDAGAAAAVQQRVQEPEIVKREVNTLME